MNPKALQLKFSQIFIRLERIEKKLDEIQRNDQGRAGVVKAPSSKGKPEAPFDTDMA